jgi:hypothetical protein
MKVIEKLKEKSKFPFAALSVGEVFYTSGYYSDIPLMKTDEGELNSISLNNGVLFRTDSNEMVEVCKVELVVYK